MAPKTRAKKKPERKEEIVCPVCILFDCLRDMTDKKSAFFHHMTNARIEFLEGIRALIDERLEKMKKGAGEKKSKLTKIEVED
jgi:hypothetical protein